MPAPINAALVATETTRFEGSFRCVPPAPHVIAHLYAQYKQRTKGCKSKISFRDYLQIIGFVNPAGTMTGTDEGQSRSVGHEGSLVDVPTRQVSGTLRLKVLLVDFSDNVGERPLGEYETMLFSDGAFASMRHFYRQVSGGKVDVVGDVHGWFRMPRPYSYYVNNLSGLGGYPRNSQLLAEHAVRAALDDSVDFPADLDKFGTGSVTALFLIHAGQGAEVFGSVPAQKRRIWSHKSDFQNPVRLREGLFATNYLTVPEDCRVGVCAHELGHLAFQWDDFYDPNYSDDGSFWDGAGNWDLMAGGSYNGNSNSPAHPAGLHKSQHGWVDVEKIDTSKTGVRIPPYTSEGGKVVRLKSPSFTSTQFLILENRTHQGFDSSLPGEGLLVWRVDTAKKQVNPDRPAMLLIQADGQHDLEAAGLGDANAGDMGDPFPGSSNRRELTDQGPISTSFPGQSRSGIKLTNIAIDPVTGDVTLDISIR